MKGRPPIEAGRPLEGGLPGRLPNPKKGRLAPDIAPEYLDIEEVDYSYLSEYERAKLDELVKMDQPMSTRELKTLELYLAGAPLHRAVSLAGYAHKTAQVRLIVGKRILEKWESKEEHGAIFRRMGFGPHRVAKILRDLAEHGPATVAVQALNIASKCLKMQIEVQEKKFTRVVIERGQGEGLEAPKPRKQKESILSEQKGGRLVLVSVKETARE